MPVNIDYFSKIDSEDKAYWLGFLTADGNVHRQGSGVFVNLSVQDQLHLDAFAKLFDKKSKPHKNRPSMCWISIPGTKLWQDLNNMGVVPNKTDADQSVIFQAVPDDLRWHFIRGMFDGDGSLCCSIKRQCQWCWSLSGESRILMAIKKWIISQCGVSDTKIEIRNRHAVIRWTGKLLCERISFAMYDGATVFLRRKHQRFQSMLAIPSKAKYRGVTKTASGKWNAFCWRDGVRRHIGNFATEKQAAMAHDAKAREWKLPRYKLNFPEVA